MYEALAHDLLCVVQQQHEAIDQLFALLVLATRDRQPHCFYPSESGLPWLACMAGYDIIARAKLELGEPDAQDLGKSGSDVAPVSSGKKVRGDKRGLFGRGGRRRS